MWVALACNDERNGRFTGFVDAISIDRIGLELERIGSAGARTRMRYAFAKHVRISRRLFTYSAHRGWYGNWCWDAVLMRPDEVRRLLRYLRDSGAWSCTEAHRWMFRWFNREASP